MKFRTECEAERGRCKIEVERPLLLVGSCFSDYMCQRMRECLWRATNPAGTLFNPLSIAKFLELATTCGLTAGDEVPRSEARQEIADSIFESGGAWHSWLGDSHFSGADSVTVAKNVIDGLILACGCLKEDATLIVTFGTAFCYYLAGKKNYVVANCHKQPGALFERRRIDMETIVDTWSKLLGRLRSLFPHMKVVFTVSPVRHVRDGLHENTLSKGILHLAVERLCKEFGFCSYFPAYEILNDDLRDYRFYADDLVHPSPKAVEYIWEKFRDTYVDESGQRLLKEGENLYRRLSHRPLIEGFPGTAAFQAETTRRLDSFLTSHPGMRDPRHDNPDMTI